VSEPASPGPAAFSPSPQYQYGTGPAGVRGYADQPPPADSLLALREALEAALKYVNELIAAREL
jgi:hypothetical protein